MACIEHQSSPPWMPAFSVLTDALYLEISGQCRDPTTYSPTLYNRIICCRDNQKSKKIKVQEIQNQISLTAVIDGLSNRPGKL